jgi:hypothetical protein
MSLQDAIQTVTDNYQKRIQETCQQIDEALSKLVAFPLSVGAGREEEQLLIDVCELYKQAGYNVMLAKRFGDDQKHRYVICINHGKPYTDPGSYVLFKC